MKRVWPIVMMISAWFASGCRSGSDSNASIFTRADSLIEHKQPGAALSLLQTMGCESLSGSDRALHALLTVKATDKAFTPHTSDSAISIALSHFRANGPTLRRAEAAYYHGRVLSDLCNYAAALDAYDNALNTLSPDTTRRALRLRSHILSQNAQLLEDLRLYSEAIPFYRAAAEASLALGDTTDAFLDIDQIVFDLIQLDSIASAETLLANALRLHPALTPNHHANLEITRRYIHLKKGEHDKAAAGIDTVLASREPRFRNFGLMTAIDAYQGLGLRDSADFYANILINQEFENNKTTAYATLLRNNLDRLGDHKTLLLFNAFDSLTDLQANTFRKAPQIVGTEFLKYRMEQKETVRLLRQKHTLIFAITGAFLLMLMLIALLLSLRARNIRRRLDFERKQKEFADKEMLLEQSNSSLHEKNGLLSTHNKLLSKEIAQLAESNASLCERNENLMLEYTSLTERHTLLTEQYIRLSQLNHRLSEINSDLEARTLIKPNFDESREKLVEDILRNYCLLSEKSLSGVQVDISISGCELCKRISNRTTLPRHDKTWNELETLLQNKAPGFMDTISRLYSGSNIDYLHIIMLIRVGFKTTKIAELLSKASNTISTHKTAICNEMFMGKVTVKELNSVIISISTF
ncbi:MAG: hypothetical protein HDS02_04570 [Bacteroides sp.]|nr:hypothetical protein [Bacteroides sp.]